MKLHSILSFHWSTPLVSCSNCSHHGTKSCCGLGSYRDGVFSHLLSGQKQSQTWMTASQDNSLHQLSVQTSNWRSCSHRREGSVPAMVKRVKSDDQAVLHWQAHRWCWKRSEVIVIMCTLFPLQWSWFLRHSLVTQWNHSFQITLKIKWWSKKTGGLLVWGSTVPIAKCAVSTRHQKEMMLS